MDPNNFREEEFKKVDETSDFETLNFPISMVKKIMKEENNNVIMKTDEAYMVMAKTCELFIKDVTKRSWFKVEQRRNLGNGENDAIIGIKDTFDAIVDIVCETQVMDEKTQDSPKKYY